MPLIEIFLRDFLFILMGVAVLCAHLIARPHSTKGARAALRYCFYCYLLSAAVFITLYMNQVGLTRADNYLILSFCSLVLVFAYSSLELTESILYVMICELFLILLNFLSLGWEAISPSTDITLASLVHLQITDIINYTALLLLTWNWWSGGRISNYSRRLDKTSSVWSLILPSPSARTKESESVL